MPYKNPDDKKRYQRDYMRKVRHNKKVEKKIGLTGRIGEDDLEPEPRRKVDSIEDRPDFILERNLKELYEEIPEEDRIVDMYGSRDPGLSGPDPYLLDKEIGDNDIVIDPDTLEFETGREYKKRVSPAQ